ncbi:MAG: nitrate- and nitrite sensing domain-containing protein [Pseudomonadota bacterium]
MRIIANLKISVAILILMAAAFAAIIFLSSKIIMGDMKVSKDLSDISKLTELSTLGSNLLDEQQKERGYTGIFISSKGEKFKSELATQRSVVDKQKTALKDFVKGFDAGIYGTKFSDGLNKIISAIDKMEQMRSSIDSLSIERPAALGYYTEINTSIIDLVANMAEISNDSEVSLKLISFSNFMRAKELAGLERATGAGGFTVGSFTEAEVKRFESLVASQNAYRSVFLTYASATQKSLFEKLVEDSSSKEVARMEAIVSENNPDNVKTVQVGTWMDNINKKISLMREVEESFASDLKEQMKTSIDNASATQKGNITIISVTLLVISIFSFVIVRSIIASINKTAVATEELANGNLSAKIPEHTNNEVGRIIAALEVFKQNALQMEKIKMEQAEQEKNATAEKRRMMHQMADNFETSVKGAVSQVASAAIQMQSGAESVTNIAEDTKKRSNIVVNASTQAAQTSSQVAAAAEELTASIKEISEQTQKSKNIASEAAAKAEFAKGAINMLSEKAMSVAQIIEVITGIAGQINLLALNATIESARAGEAGKGFAVVASEVKNLANQVGKATGEITQQINEMQGATKTSVDSVMDILEIINQVSVSTSAVASAIEEQSAVTTEIAHNVARTSSGTQEISQNMTSVQDGAEKTGETALGVLSSAKNLNQQSDVLKQKIDEFLQTIRA